MRYIIIPLAIILYVWWSCESIKNIKTGYKYDFIFERCGIEVGKSEILWSIFTVIILLTILAKYIIVPLFIFTVNNW